MTTIIMTMGYCLSIETSSAYLGLALFSFNVRTGARRLIKSHFSPGLSQQSEHLIPVLDKMLKEARLKKAQLSLVSVDIGPGSFTGVRVGVATARALGQGLKVPVVGVSSLEALAREAELGGRKKTLILACIPALAGELYYAGYRAGPSAKMLQSVIPPTWKKEDEFRHLLAGLVSSQRKNPIVVLSNRQEGNTVAGRWGDVEWRNVPAAPHPVKIAEIGIQKFAARPTPKTFSYHRVVPLYLQPSWAEKERGEK
ncbi:MAG: tRNA (adenosine(37)-N6)-threonylcarbamoyltransferase complex dimerization subunit type 1 TsaB [Elusimicrobia bacterium]|nr:tRNA (adenosine(37)-N6)-threonylcarbamoyltransferase complex dimerization subunit type 1 TsaB [Candidatus Obscuribacterium magneticum]MCB4755857.1 tRNA (adenosine(37)-N6)-threonylcarbamoyltransferase complex dimerization subunit type 1 TsaB [Candidatus Obscuribacterium magneticum]